MSTNHLPLITLEEHFTSAAAAKLYGDPTSEFGPNIGSKLQSLTEPRLKDMNAAGVSRQVLSHTPFRTAPTPALCAGINDELHSHVTAHPDHFAGFATLPMTEPATAAAELTRTVRELGFVGALVDAHSEGMFYDGQEWDVFWGTAQELDVPIYIHPCYASEEMMRVNYRGNYGEDVAKGLGAWVFGWHVETG